MALELVGIFAMYDNLKGFVLMKPAYSDILEFILLTYNIFSIPDIYLLGDQIDRTWQVFSTCSLSHCDKKKKVNTLKRT